MREPRDRIEQLERLHAVGLALSAERDKRKLIERILLEAKEMCRADGGTLYTRSDDDHLVFEILRTDSLKLAFGGTAPDEVPFSPVPLFISRKEENRKNVASHCVHERCSVNIADAYDAEGFDFAGTKAFDAENGYRTQSVLTIPMLNQADQVIGVLQLLNARDKTGKVVPFASDLQELVEALAAQAAAALDNLNLLSDQRKLMESFIKLIAAAIDAKSPYTGGHCRRVPVLTELITEAVCASKTGPFADFDLSDEARYELHIAGWLHDCGKVTTPVHVMDKATKLETIFDRIALVEQRFMARARQLERDAAINGTNAEAALTELREDFAFITASNTGGEFMSDDRKARVRRIAEQTVEDLSGNPQPLLTPDEVYNLCISRGTLTEEERVIINGHMVQTIEMLRALPFPRSLRRVPEYAGGHHERMDGTGYPKGLFAGDMSIPARIMAIADVFEALTAADRPYKKGKSLSEAMRIMGVMKQCNHLDPQLFDEFIKSGVYKEYGARFLAAAQIDEVDEAMLLAIEPRPYELPAEEIRQQRVNGYAAPYDALVAQSIDLPNPED